MRDNDKFLEEIQIDKHAVLQRVINGGGCPYSLILLGEREMWSAPTSEEARLLCQYFRDRDLIFDIHSDPAANKVLFENEQPWIPALVIIEDIKDEIEHMTSKQYEDKEMLDKEKVISALNKHIFELDRSRRDKER